MTASRIRRRAGLIVILLAFPVLAYLAATRGLYFFPTSFALGPCLPDWTNIGTYSALFDSPASPMGTTRFKLGDGEVQICYGRPSAKGRRIFELPSRADSDASEETAGAEQRALVPNGQLWRLGANEPTRIFTNQSILFGDIRLDPGRYSFYAIPGEQDWQVFVTRSTFHWGNMINSYVRSREVGSTTARISESDEHIEMMTITVDETNQGEANLVVAWSSKRVHIPLRNATR